MEGLLSLLGQETFDSFFSIDDFALDLDNPSRLLYGRTPSDSEHAQMPTMEALGGAGCSDWNMDHYLLQASDVYEESTSKVNSAKMPRLANSKTEEEIKQARQARVPKKTQMDTRYCNIIWKT